MGSHIYRKMPHDKFTDEHNRSETPKCETSATVFLALWMPPAPCWPNLLYHNCDNIFTIPNYTKSTAYTSCLGRWSSVPSCKKKPHRSQHVTDVGRMPHASMGRMLHAMLACGMQVLICGGHVVHKHGKGLWCSANMFVVRGMGLCAPKYAPMCTPPQVWCQYGQNMRRTCASLSLPPSRTPCPPFRTFTLCLHPHISKREPVRGQAN